MDIQGLGIRKNRRRRTRGRGREPLCQSRDPLDALDVASPRLLSPWSFQNGPGPFSWPKGPAQACDGRRAPNN
uniref:Uncharacterized protein n=1 Tax=Triticum urartu TaxID=4572 RepID=A0A8R7U9F1_TRIUA